MDGSYVTICAVVDASTEEEAKEEIERFWIPRSWRFCGEKEPDWEPGDRFPWPKRDDASNDNAEA